MKLESKDHSEGLLEHEWEVSKLLKKKTGKVKAFDYSEREHSFNILVLPLLGPNLSKIRRRCGGSLSLRTTLLLLDQLLYRVQNLHRDNLVHRDIQPRNCVLGLGKAGNIIHLIDYGIATLARSGEELQASREGLSSLVGTLGFASISAFQGDGKCTLCTTCYRWDVLLKPIGRDKFDDLESLAYLAVFLQKDLPWQDDLDAEECLRKRHMSAEEICVGLEPQFAAFLAYARERKASEPDYGYLRRVFRLLFRNKGYKYDSVFDWTRSVHEFLSKHPRQRYNDLLRAQTPQRDSNSAEESLSIA